MKKKIIIAVVVIVALIVGVLGYMVISDMGQEDKLKTELSEINDLANAETIDMDEINKRLDRTVTTGDYAKVEDAFKSYLKDSFDNSIEIANLINDEKITTLLTADNYNTDGKEFIESKKYISTTRQKLEECKEKYSEYMTKEKAMSYIEGKGLDSYYVDLYEQEYVGDMDSAKEAFILELMDISEDIALEKFQEEIINDLYSEKEAECFIIDLGYHGGNPEPNFYNELYKEDWFTAAKVTAKDYLETDLYDFYLYIRIFDYRLEKLTEEEQQKLLATRENLEQRLLEEYGNNASFEIYFADGNKSEYEDGKKVEE